MFHVYATQLLRNDHKGVKALFLQFDAIDQRLMEGGRMSEGSDRKTALVDEILLNLEVHTQIEEEIFYPAVAEASDVNGRGMVEASYDDHAGAKELIASLRKMQIDSREFDDQFQVLRKEIEAHIEFEEEKLLPLAEHLLSAKLGEIGAKMETRKIELMKDRNYIHDVAQNPEGGEQKRIA